MAPVLNRTGLNLDREFFRALAGRVSMLSWYEKPARINSESQALGFKLRDATASRQVLERFAAKFPKQLTKTAFGTIHYYQFPVRSSRRGNAGEEVFRKAIGCLAIVDDYFFICDNVKLLQQMLIAKNDSARRLASSSDYQVIAGRIQRQLGGTSAGMTSFSRPEESFRQLYDLAASEAMRARWREQGEENRFFKGLDSALTQHPLPPVTIIGEYLTPRGGFIANDDTGFHYMGFSLRREANR